MRRKLTVARLVEQASRCATRHEFKHRYQPAYKKACRLDIMTELFGPKQHVTTVHEGHGRTPFWTLERLKKTAARYKTRFGFRRKQPGAYMAAYLRNQLEEVCAHMPKRVPFVKKRPNVELIAAAAAEHDTMKAFKAAYCGGYVNAMRFGLIPGIVADMKTRRQAKAASQEPAEPVAEEQKG
jgi:hypothetical protein